jgi:hypothetical protein
MNRAEFNEHFNKTGLKTLRGLWVQLKIQFPKLNKVAVRIKKDRDNVAVRVCSCHNYIVQFLPMPSHQHSPGAIVAGQIDG